MNFTTGYVRQLDSGILLEKVELFEEHYGNCCLCPHNCGVNRKIEKGFCLGKDKAIVASYGPHFGEEEELVGRRGSGTIFFGYCNMRCVFCQNYELSFYGKGNIVSNEKLSDMMLKLQNHYKCHNINLVTPTHFLPNILRAIYIAARKGLKLPIVYNCGGYEKPGTLRLLDGIVDIYMPDFKYFDSKTAHRFSGVKDYSNVVKDALKEMDKQVGGLKANEVGIAYKGLLIRHLMLPSMVGETKNILDFIKSNLSRDCAINLMKQYYPAHRAHEYMELNKRLSSKEYAEALNYGRELSIRFV